jgi:hypothetical protein
MHNLVPLPLPLQSNPVNVTMTFITVFLTHSMQHCLFPHQSAHLNHSAFPCFTDPMNTSSWHDLSPHQGNMSKYSLYSQPCTMPLDHLLNSLSYYLHPYHPASLPLCTKPPLHPLLLLCHSNSLHTKLWLSPHAILLLYLSKLYCSSPLFTVLPLLPLPSLYSVCTSLSAIRSLTSRHGRVVSTPPSYSAGPGLKSWPGYQLSWDLSCFP